MALDLEYLEGPSAQYSRSLVLNTIKDIVLGTGVDSQRVWNMDVG